MKNNNGKIAIAIVAMFVVALSVVGFTYAYFTAQVVGNTEDESVKVTAGELVIDYKLNKTISAQNVVPNWASDGDKYYDPINSVKKEGNENQIVAVSYATYEGAGIPLTEGMTLPKTLGSQVMGTLSTDQKSLLNAYGLTEPAMFTVKNTGTDTAYYAIELRDITNGIVAGNAADEEYVRVELYSSTDNLAYDSTSWGDPIYDEPLAATGETQVIASAASVTADETVDKDDTRDGQTIYYKLVLKYDNSGVKQNVPATGETNYSSKTLSASVYVRGLGQYDPVASKPVSTTAPAPATGE